ncbi:MAG: DUF481 domain-containing protein [Zetaproteobacteria bacterium]|nr:MAG: DUF481 domain-containing protein [Zetaproteobacteria bacterium]
MNFVQKNMAGPNEHASMPTMRTLISALLLLLVLPATSALAIVNVDDAIIDPKQAGFQQLAHLALDGARGNTNRVAIKGDALSRWHHARHTEYLAVQFAYGKSLGVTDTNRIYAHARHRTQYTERWAVEAFGQLERDPFARLEQRLLVGGGFRLTITAQEAYAWYLGLGTFHEWERLSPLGGTRATDRRWRLSNYLLFNRRINEQLGFSTIAYYQPAWRMPGDYRVLAQSALTVHLSDRLALKLSADYRYDARPPQQVKPTDVSYSTGMEFAL